MDAKHPFQIRPLWWLGQAALILVGGFFLVVGVQLLMAAYDLPDPFTFIMTFFAACLIILISATLLIGFFVRLHMVYRYLKTPTPPEAGTARDLAIPSPEASPLVENSTPDDSSETEPDASADVERPAESPER
jgi:hypothetical protein